LINAKDETQEAVLGGPFGYLGVRSLIVGEGLLHETRSKIGGGETQEVKGPPLVRYRVGYTSMCWKTAGDEAPGCSGTVSLEEEQEKKLHADTGSDTSTETEKATKRANFSITMDKRCEIALGKKGKSKQLTRENYKRS